MANHTSRKDRWNRAELAALILLAPGGFILGFTLAARHYGKRRSRPAAAPRTSAETAKNEAADDHRS